MLRRLEVEVQDLELQAEGLRAAYVLNKEKLNFSHHILSQREAENRVLVTKLKRQMAAQARTLGSLKVSPVIRLCSLLFACPGTLHTPAACCCRSEAMQA